MALELKIEVTERAANCSGFTVADTTGAYEATENPTGYGAPNPERAAYKAVLMADRTNSNGSTAIDVPEGIAEWEVPTTQDGYYDLLLVLSTPFNLFSSYAKNKVRIYNNALYLSTATVGMQKAWTAGEIDLVLQQAGIYDATTMNGAGLLADIGVTGNDLMYVLADQFVDQSVLDNIPSYIEAAGLSEEPDSNWLKIVTIDQYPFLTSGTDAYFARIPHHSWCYTDKCKLNRDTAFAASNCDSCEDDTAAMMAYYLVEQAYKGSIYNFGLKNYTKAGDQIEMAQRICEEKGGNCGC